MKSETAILIRRVVTIVSIIVVLAFVPAAVRLCARVVAEELRAAWHAEKYASP